MFFKQTRQYTLKQIHIQKKKTLNEIRKILETHPILKPLDSLSF